MKLHTVCIAPGFSLQLIWFDLSNQKQIGPSCGRGGLEHEHMSQEHEHEHTNLINMNMNMNMKIKPYNKCLVHEQYKQHKARNPHEPSYEHNDYMDMLT